MSTMFVRVGDRDNLIVKEVRYIPLHFVPNVVCAWCPTFNRNDPKNRNATHGICPSCAKRFFSQLEAVHG